MGPRIHREVWECRDIRNLRRTEYRCSGVRGCVRDRSQTIQTRFTEPKLIPIAGRISPPTRLRRFGAASFAWLAEP